jgi:anti-sigma B factor antagonist
MTQPRFTFSTDNHTLNIRINEEHFDAAHTADFKKMVDNQWKKGIRSVTIDMRLVKFIDSSGIGALLGIQKRLTNSEDPVVLANTTPNVSSIIELLRLHRVFSMQ